MNVAVPASGSMRRRSSRPTVVLPEPGLADQAVRLALVDVEVDVVDRTDGPVLGSPTRRREDLREPASLEQGSGHRRERIATPEGTR